MNPPVWPSSVRFCAAAGSAVRRAANNKHNGKQQSPEQRNPKLRNAKLQDEERNIRGERMIFPFHPSSERTGERPWPIENHPVVTQIWLDRLAVPGRPASSNM